MRKLIKQKKKLQQSAGSPLKRNLHPDSPQRHKVTPDRDARLMTKGGIQEVPPRASRRRISFAGGWRSAWHCDVVWYGSQQCRASTAPTTQRPETAQAQARPRVQVRSLNSWRRMADWWMALVCAKSGAGRKSREGAAVHRGRNVDSNLRDVVESLFLAAKM